jgi:NAD(P)-dependent dehydrogenase (short-subunit alcohol dehydrogenase family)
VTSADRPLDFPQLAGKVVAVGAESTLATEICIALAANGAMVGVIAPSHEITQRIRDMAHASDRVLAFTADPGAAEVWQRVTPHIEQRLGPIDVVIAVATERSRRIIVDALLPDLAARRHGVVVEVGEAVAARDLPGGARFRGVQGDSAVAPEDLTAAVLAAATGPDVADQPVVTVGRR